MKHASGIEIIKRNGNENTTSSNSKCWNKFKNFIKKEWSLVLAIIVILVPFFLAFYFTYQNKTEKTQPTNCCQCLPTEQKQKDENMDSYPCYDLSEKNSNLYTIKKEKFCFLNCAKF